MIGKGETGREEEDAGAFFHPSAVAILTVWVRKYVGETSQQVS